MLIRNQLYILAILSLLLPGAGHTASSHKNKPQPPVQVTITQGHPSTSTAAVKAGDVVPISLKIIPAIDSTEMRIVCMLSEGVELVTGELAWSGPAKKGEERILLLSVRLPKSGKGRIASRVELYSGDVLLFTSSTDHKLGPAEEEKSRPPLGVRKDSKGRQVEEYR